MSLKEFIKSLGAEGLADYAARCNSTPAYISNHILHARKEPRKALREALSRESDGKVSHQEVLAHFGIADTASADTAA